MSKATEIVVENSEVFFTSKHKRVLLREYVDLLRNSVVEKQYLIRVVKATISGFGRINHKMAVLGLCAKATTIRTLLGGDLCEPLEKAFDDLEECKRSFVH